jgi:hypothetical protein
VPRPENNATYKRYKALADATPGVHFVGRLATYKYYNMDQVTAQALTTFKQMNSGERVSRNGKRRSMLYPALTDTSSTQAPQMIASNQELDAA